MQVNKVTVWANSSTPTKVNSKGIKENQNPPDINFTKVMIQTFQYIDSFSLKLASLSPWNPRIGSLSTTWLKIRDTLLGIKLCRSNFLLPFRMQMCFGLNIHFRKLEKMLVSPNYVCCYNFRVVIIGFPFFFSAIGMEPEALACLANTLMLDCISGPKTLTFREILQWPNLWFLLCVCLCLSVCAYEWRARSTLWVFHCSQYCFKRKGITLKHEPTDWTKHLASEI